MKLTKILTTVVLLSSMVLANLDDAIDTIGKELQQSLLRKKSKMIAVIDFNNLDGSINNLGRNISEKLAIKLFRLNKDNNYTIVERGQLSKILQELKLSASGLVEPKTMKKIGKIYGVDTVISGSLTDLGNDIEIKVKALSVETGGLMGVSESKIPKTNMVKNLYTQNLVEGQYTTVEGKKTTTIQSRKMTKNKRNSKEIIITPDSKLVTISGMITAVEEGKENPVNTHIIKLSGFKEPKKLIIDIANKDGQAFGRFEISTPELQTAIDTKQIYRKNAKTTIEHYFSGDKTLVFKARGYIQNGVISPKGSTNIFTAKIYVK